MNLTWLLNPMWLIVNSLVAFRLTRLLVSDALPGLAMLRHRVKVWSSERWEQRQGARRPPGERTDEDVVYPDGHLVTLLSCYWCAGFWVSVAVVFIGAGLLPVGLWAALAAPLALSAIVGLLSNLTD